MIEIDLEDYLEEVKFQMTEYDNLDEETILDWEAKARKYVKEHEDKRHRIIKTKHDVILKIKSEDEMEEVARLFYKAVKDDKELEYWKKFSLIL